jgi:hypothetical protein
MDPCPVRELAQQDKKKNHRIRHSRVGEADYNQQRWKLEEERAATEKCKIERGTESTR